MNLFSSKFFRTTPEFWSKFGITAFLLIPFCLIYFFVIRFLSLKKIDSQKLPAKIICVGNITAGGSGKTPACIEIGQILKNKYSNKKICVVSKGFGGSNKSPKKVEPQKDSADVVGDEPLLISKYMDCFVGKNRLETCKFAIENGFQIIILDDGIHDKTIHKDVNLVVIDGGYGLGNKLLIPAGPLRDRIDIPLKITDAIILIGEDKTGAIDFIKLKSKTLPKIFNAEIQPKNIPDTSSDYIAFAGIGIPEKFFNSLEKLQVKLVDKVKFADHYEYNSDDEENLMKLAEEKNSKLITTEKDFIKLSDEMKKNVFLFEIKINFSDKNFSEIF
jgi:tetraacyldisaccharide 4'-kinase